MIVVKYEVLIQSINLCWFSIMQFTVVVNCQAITITDTHKFIHIIKVTGIHILIYSDRNLEMSFCVNYTFVSTLESEKLLCLLSVNVIAKPQNAIYL